MEDPESVYQKLLFPTPDLIRAVALIEGDIMILGIGGKMGPSLAWLAKKSIDLAGIKKKVIGVARFSDPNLKHSLENEGIETIQADILNDEELSALPNTENVLYLAGTKFGTLGNEPYTWAMNTYLPGRVAQKFKDSRIVVFSTGNVYPFTTVNSFGATEQVAPAPIGEYGQSCLGRERMFQYYSSLYKTPLLIYRLNYAIDVSYGVLLEIAKAVNESKLIDLRMGFVNVIWQKDANEIALRALAYCSTPAKILNVTGHQVISVRWLANEIGKRFARKPTFINVEEPTALLSDASECTKLFGTPLTSIEQMIDLITIWVLAGGKTINKPTHFSERSGNF